VNVIPIPKSEIIGNKLICDNEEVTLESLFTSDTLTYLWSTGSTKNSIIINQPGWYWLVVKNSQGCYDSSAVNIKKFNNLHLDIVGSKVICSPNTGILSANVTPYDSTLNYVYEWSNDFQTRNITVTKAGIYSVKVTIENKCVLYSEISVVKSEAPDLVLNKSGVLNLCEGEIIELYDINELPDLSYQWSDGMNGNKRLITKSGFYKLTVTNQEGCSDSDSLLVIINKKPVVSIEYQTYRTECDRDSAMLIAHPLGIGYKYKWSDGSFNDSIVVKKSGLYFVYVTDSNGCSNSSSINVKIGSGMDIQINGEKDFCRGDSITLTAIPSFSGFDTDFEYLWSTGETTKSIIIRNGGQYYVNVTHKDGCKGIDTINVNVLEIPDLKLNYNGIINICSNDTLSLEPEIIVPEYSYLWSDGFNQINRKISKNGVYTLFASNGNLCIDSATVEVTVKDLPKVSIVVNGKNLICPGEKTELEASDTTGLQFKWSTGENNFKVNVNMPGIYTLYYSNTTGCKDSTSIEIEGSPDIEFNLITTNYSLCNGDSAILSTDKKFSVYNWSNGENTETITIHESGTYSVNIIDSNGCVGIATIKITNHTFDNIFKIIGPTYSTECNLKIKLNLQIQNISEHDFLIKDIQSSLSNVEIINKNEILGILSSNVFKEIQLLFNFTNPDSLTSIIKIFAESPCNFEYDFPVSAKSYSETLIWADTVITQSGSDLCIPVYYKLLCPDKLNGSQNADFSIEFGSNYFYPETVTHGKIISIETNDLTTKLKVSVDSLYFNNNDSLLLLICGKVLIGKKLPGEISFYDFTWQNQYILDSTLNGALITELCAIEIRGIRLYKPTSLNVNPNPAGEDFKINVTTQSVGNHIIFIYDSRGDMIKKIEFNIEENSPINQTFLLNSSDLNQGIYNIILNSPWSIRSTNLVIIR
jgi:hypothetical protein